MKKLILILLFPIMGYSQQSIQHYFVSSQNLAGAEMIVNTGNDTFIGGAGLYGQMRNFEENGIAYHKNDKLIFVLLVRFNAQYSISDDIGAFAGVDTFNGFKISLSIEL